jgi:hypothetical protein
MLTLEQIRQDLKDLGRCVTEWAERSAPATGGQEQPTKTET